jgi:hypothetical protein
LHLCQSNCCRKLASASLVFARQVNGTLNGLLQTSQTAMAGVALNHFTTLRPRFGIWHLVPTRSVLVAQSSMAALVLINKGECLCGTAVYQDLPIRWCWQCRISLLFLNMDELGKPASRSGGNSARGRAVPVHHSQVAEHGFSCTPVTGESTWTKRRFFRTAATEMRSSSENGRFA